MPTLSTLQIIALVVVFVCAAIDFRTRKIPNLITFPAAAVGIILNFVMFGWQAGLFAILGWFVGVFIMLLPDPRGKVGYGDAKLMGAMGALLGWKLTVIAWGYYAIGFGLVSLIRLLIAIPWKTFAVMVKSASVGVTPVMDKEAAEKVSKSMKAKIPVGPAIAVGVALAIALQDVTLRFLGFAG